MNVSLTPAQETFVKQKVKSGKYASQADVLREALDLLRAQEELTQDDVAELRELVDVGLAEFERGETAEFTAADIAVLGRRILAARKRSAKTPSRKRAS